mgnify:CR=1 FL=1
MKFKNREKIFLIISTLILVGAVIFVLTGTRVSEPEITYHVFSIPVTYEEHGEIKTQTVNYCGQYWEEDNSFHVYYENSGMVCRRVVSAFERKYPHAPVSVDAYIQALDAKLSEELAEYQQSKSLEELADLLEVMGAVVKARGYTWDELTCVRKEKRAQRGAFEQRVFLKEVIG